MRTKITELSHDDLVNLISTATYGNNYLGIRVPDSFKHLDVGNTWEDGLANVLLNGGQLEIIDQQSEEPKDDFESYGTHAVEPKWESFDVAPWLADEQGKWGHVVYTIDLSKILNGCNHSAKSIRLAFELFVEEQGDMWTAYNLMQLILFDDIIYA